MRDNGTELRRLSLADLIVRNDPCDILKREIKTLVFLKSVNLQEDINSETFYVY